MFITFLLLTLIAPADYGGLPFDAQSPGLSFSVTSRAGFPNFENPATFGLVTREGVLFNFAYSSIGFQDILNYSYGMDFKKLTALAFYSKNGAFSYRPILRKKISDTNSEKAYSIDEFGLTLADLLYYKLYGGISVNYINVRYGEALVEDSIPKVRLINGHGFSINLGLLYKIGKFDFGVAIKNVISGVYFPEDVKDVLEMAGSVGAGFTPKEYVSVSFDCLAKPKERINFSGGLKVKPLKWASLIVGYNLNQRSFSFGGEINYKDNDWLISYGANSWFITWRYYIQ